jgi:uncharacterized membrane protein
MSSHHRRAAECERQVADPWSNSQLGTLINALGRPPVSCLLDLVANHLSCNQPVDLGKLKTAWDTFLQNSGLHLPSVGTATSYATELAQRLGGLFSLFMYLPLFILGIFVIWGLVGLRKIGWGLGFFLTILLVFFLYLMTVLFRYTIEQIIVRVVNYVQNYANKHSGEIKSVLSKAPAAALSAVCTYTGHGCS